VKSLQTDGSTLIHSSPAKQFKDPNTKAFTQTFANTSTVTYDWVIQSAWTLKDGHTYLYEFKPVNDQFIGDQTVNLLHHAPSSIKSSLTGGKYFNSNTRPSTLSKTFLF
jgi:hypothetical protein